VAGMHRHGCQKQYRVRLIAVWAPALEFNANVSYGFWRWMQ
jgi:hypothetical protein